MACLDEEHSFISCNFDIAFLGTASFNSYRDEDLTDWSFQLQSYRWAEACHIIVKIFLGDEKKSNQCKAALENAAPNLCFEGQERNVNLVITKLHHFMVLAAFFKYVWTSPTAGFGPFDSFSVQRTFNAAWNRHLHFQWFMNCKKPLGIQGMILNLA